MEPQGRRRAQLPSAVTGNTQQGMVGRVVAPPATMSLSPSHTLGLSLDLINQICRLVPRVPSQKPGHSVKTIAQLWGQGVLKYFGSKGFFLSFCLSLDNKQGLDNSLVVGDLEDKKNPGVGPFVGQVSPGGNRDLPVLSKDWAELALACMHECMSACVCTCI